ncbi:MAG TPA: ribonuclease HII [Terriglobales bacterium]|nr:ribonuclease HII [Terriglobales bacterium]
MPCSGKFEKQAMAAGFRCIAGVDEVGRGALFGPVVAAAVVLNPDDRIRGLNDSKLLTPDEREVLSRRIRARALAWAVAAQDAAVIDTVNILQASRRAMVMALEALSLQPDYILVDAVTLDWQGPQQAIIHGDALSISIAAASIVAKVYRDDLVSRWDGVFPAYQLASNKGYGVPDHLAALDRHGPSPLHRRSFAPVLKQQ